MINNFIIFFSLHQIFSCTKKTSHIINQLDSIIQFQNERETVEKLHLCISTQYLFLIKKYGLERKNPKRKKRVVG